MADENLPLFSIRLLRAAGFDMEAIAKFAAGAADMQVFAHAVEQEQVLVTFDRDFGELIFTCGGSGLLLALPYAG